MNAPHSVDPEHSVGFAPIAALNSSVLILGSLPGRMSLDRGEYYALPRNAFWRILGDLFKLGPDVSYADRQRGLIERGIALWDVCGAARRRGSLDSAIQSDSIIVNDFASFLGRHRQIDLICFNGAKAGELYRRQVLPGLPAVQQAIRCVQLPSTSPAHAGMPYAEKVRRWALLRDARPG